MESTLTNYGDLKRTALVRLAHERFGSTVDPIHTSNDLIRTSLEAGDWRGSNVGQVVTKVVLPEIDAERLADTNESPVIEAKNAETGKPVYIVDDWDASKHIPDMSVFKAYHARKVNGKTDIEMMSDAFTNGQNVLLQSDAGTGKNHLIEAVCAKLQLPQVAVSLSGGATVEDLIGQYVLVQGSTHWVDGIMTSLFRPTGIGGAFTADEINACPPEITFVCHQATDHRRTLVLAQRGREVLRAHKRFVFVGTMNPDYIGTRPLNAAMRDRFNLKHSLDYDTKIEAKILAEKGLDKTRIKQLLSLASKLREAYRSSVHEITVPFSTRMLINYADNCRIHGENIARSSMIASFDALEQVTVREAVSLFLDAAVGGSEMFDAEAEVQA